MNVTIFNQ